MIVRTDNRILATFYRKKREPIMDCWISDSQQGFISGRSLALNVVRVGSLAPPNCLKWSRGCALLLDFKAALLSISRKLLFKMLEHLGVPKHVQDIIKNVRPQMYYLLWAGRGEWLRGGCRDQTGMPFESSALCSGQRYSSEKNKRDWSQESRFVFSLTTLHW